MSNVWWIIGCMIGFKVSRIERDVFGSSGINGVYVEGIGVVTYQTK